MGNDYVETDARDFGNKYFGEIAGPYVVSYLYDSTSLDKDFGIRKGEDGDFRIGRSLIEIDENSNIHVDVKTRKKVNKSLITTRDLKNYRRILEASSVHKKQ